VANVDSSQEKTEEPTGRKLEKAREEGQVARSKELGTTAILLSAAVAFLTFGPALGKHLENILRYSFSMTREEIFDPAKPIIHLGAMAQEAAIALVPFMLVLVIAGVVGNTALGGFLFSGNSLKPKFSRLNPIEGMKRMFSLKSLMELFKAMIKTLLVGGVGWFLLNDAIPQLRDMAMQDAMVSISHAVELMAWSFFYLSCSLILIAMVDIPFQIYDNNEKLRMTRQEVKDEHKDTEGKPEIKRKIRQLQYEMTQRRMLQDVPQADVVITNPTHFSVALKYSPKTMRAPIVVAKGADHMALKIREIAKAHGVEMVETPPLTRAIYYHTDINQEVPSGVYLAVAQVLAYVFQLRRYRRGYGKRPGQLPIFDIPADLRKDL